MSLDIELIEDNDLVFEANITHNLCEMAEELGLYLPLWRNKKSGVYCAGDLIVPLVVAINNMREDPAKYKAFDSPNGWGTYDDFLPWLEDLLVACKNYPCATIETSV